jgi:hypothetical protein
MSWLNRLRGRKAEPSAEVQAALDQLATWLATPTVGYEKRVGKVMEDLAKAWGVPVREESAKGVVRFFTERLTQLQTGTTSLSLEVDHDTAWWDTPSGHVFSLQARFDRQEVEDQLLSGRMYQVGRIGANRYIVVGR